jgi:hypothetical protein
LPVQNLILSEFTSSRYWAFRGWAAKIHSNSLVCFTVCLHLLSDKGGPALIPGCVVSRVAPRYLDLALISARGLRYPGRRAEPAACGGRRHRPHRPTGTGHRARGPASCAARLPASEGGKAASCRDSRQTDACLQKHGREDTPIYTTAFALGVRGGATRTLPRMDQRVAWCHPETRRIP